MKRVGVREFRDHATHYLSQGEIFAVERHGRPIGFFIPVRVSAEDDVRQALERLHRVVEQVLEHSGMTEDELSQALDLNQPAPDAPGD
jgi:antitoxin (DNA-binding transcriptional repressor) of toxin-antitoxin stability system